MELTALQNTPWSTLCDEVPFKVLVGNSCPDELTLKVGLTFNSNVTTVGVNDSNIDFPTEIEGPFVTRIESVEFTLAPGDSRELFFWIKGENINVNGNFEMICGFINDNNSIIPRRTLFYSDPFANAKIIDGSLVNDLLPAPSQILTYSDCLAPGTIEPGSSNTSAGAYVVTDEFTVDYTTGVFCMSATNHSINRRVISMTNEDAIIRIENGAHLRLEDFVIKGCSELWESIIVEDGGRLTLIDCEIRDGFQAIKVESGGTVEINRCTFKDNYISLDIRNANNWQGNSAEAVSISRNIFEGTGKMKAPYIGERPLAGIIAVNLPDLTLHAAQSNSGGLRNIFREMKSGIRCRNTNLTVHGGLFEDINTGGFDGDAIRSLGGIGSQGNYSLIVENADFNNCFRGIQSERNLLRIEDVKMVDVNYGIRIERSNNMIQEVLDNKIGASTIGIDISGIPSAELLVFDNDINMTSQFNPEKCYGIRANLVPNVEPIEWLIENNRIRLDNTKHGIFIHSGMNTVLLDNAVSGIGEELEKYELIRLNGTQNAIVRCNSTYATGSYEDFGDARGIMLRETGNALVRCNTTGSSEIGIDIDNISVATNISGNNFSDNQIGLLLGENASIGNQFYRGNLFGSPPSTVPTVDVFGADHLGGLENALQSPFIVNNSSNQDYLPDLPLDLTGWFNPVNQFGNFICPANNCGYEAINPFTGNEDDKLLQNIVRDELVSNGFNAALRHSGARQLYRGIQQSAMQVNTGGLLDSFLIAEQNSIVGELYDIESKVMMLFSVDSIRRDSMSGFWSTILSDTEGIRIKDSLLEISKNPTTTATLISEISSLKASRDTAQQLYYSMLSNIEDSIVANQVSLVSDNQSIIATAIYETNQKTVTDLFLKTFAIGNELDSVQLLTIESIADQCPFAGGQAVYQARAMLGEGSYDDDALCAAASQNSDTGSKYSENLDFTIFPNPSRGQFSLLLPEGVQEIILRNSMGQEVKRWTGEDFGELWEVSGLGLISGMYYFTVETELNKATRPLIITK